MKLLWLCNNAPGLIRTALTGKEAGEVNWVDHVLSDLRHQDVTMRILYRGGGEPGQLDAFCSYAPVPETPAHLYRPELAQAFQKELEAYQPDVIHIWGVEYHHALAMVNAAKAAGMLDRTVASIQGLCCRIAPHFTDGLPKSALHPQTFRDFLRRDSIANQQRVHAQRGKLEIQALQTLRHVIGRTDWDRETVLEINPKLTYHFCNETLRKPFYEGQWSYEACEKHSIFASSCVYPIKGFHLLLAAMPEVLRQYPDARINVCGRPFLQSGLRQNGYEKYLAGLAKKYGLTDKITYLGSLSAGQMKKNYLKANVFVLPSTMENSPNSLGEAMLLGTPSVAADVGGVASILDPEEGILCPPVSPEAIAQGICRVFALKDQAAAMGERARAHARITHDPKTNLDTLLAIYRQLSEGA